MKSPDYSKYIKNSYELVKKNRWLLVYGLILAGSSGGSFNVGNSFSDFGKALQNMDHKTPGGIEQNLGDMANSVLGTFTNSLSQWTASVPLQKWILISLLLLFLILIGIAISLVISSWAKASLISGINMALKNESVPTLENTSPTGIKYIKNLAIFSLLIGMVSIGFVVGIPLVWIVIYYIVRGFAVVKILWIILGGLTSVLAFFAVIILISIIRIYAERLIVLDGEPPSSAWSKALKIGKGSLISTIVMGIINYCVSMAVGCASIILMAISVGIPVVIAVYIYVKTKEVSGILLFLTALSLMLFIFIGMAIRAALTVFNYSNWNQLYMDFTKSQKENGK